MNDIFEGRYKFNISDDMIIPITRLNDFFYYHTQHMGLEKNRIEFILKDYTYQYLRRIGITSFSETNKSLTMWGHYAEKQKGICLEFDTSESNFVLSQVQYSEKVYTVNLESIESITLENIIEQSNKRFNYKYIGWEYEKEWRIIGKARETIKYPSKCLKAIYFGYRSNIRTYRDIIDATRDIEGLKYYRFKPYKDSYRFEFIELNLKEMEQFLIEKENREILLNDLL